MPKKLTDTEKNYIVKRLKEEALKCIVTYGIKKTTVDELVKRVNIPKGTFYLFYESKELLLYDAINDLHKDVQERLLKELGSFSEGFTAESLTDFLFKLYKQMNDTGLMNVMVNGELEYLMRRLPEDIVKENLSNDDFSVKQLIDLLGADDVDADAFSGAFRAIFLTMMYKREIGEKVYDDAIRLMLKGLVLQLFENRKNGE